MGCLKEVGMIHQYVIPEKYDQWQQCRADCHGRKMNVCSEKKL